MINDKEAKEDSGKSVRCDITPETRVGNLLDDYPGLENTLLEMAPVFKKLKNPVLRKTVAKVTTLRHAAKIGNVPLAGMINRLRKEAGLEGEVEAVEEYQFGGNKPDWIDDKTIAKTLDARQMIEEGKQPVDQVIKELGLLESGKIFELITSFVPAPLIDIAKDKGFLMWVEEEEKDLVKTYFTKKNK